MIKELFVSLVSFPSDSLGSAAGPVQTPQLCCQSVQLQCCPAPSVCCGEAQQRTGAGALFHWWTSQNWQWLCPQGAVASKLYSWRCEKCNENKRRKEVRVMWRHNIKFCFFSKRGTKCTKSMWESVQKNECTFHCRLMQSSHSQHWSNGFLQDTEYRISLHTGLTVNHWTESCQTNCFIFLHLTHKKGLCVWATCVPLLKELLCWCGSVVTGLVQHTSMFSLKTPTYCSTSYIMITII